MSLLGSVVILHPNLWIISLLHGQGGRHAGFCSQPQRHHRTCYMLIGCAGARSDGLDQTLSLCYEQHWEGHRSTQFVSLYLWSHNDAQRFHEALEGNCFLFAAYLGKLCSFVATFITKAKPPHLLFLLSKSLRHMEQRARICFD